MKLFENTFVAFIMGHPVDAMKDAFVHFSKDVKEYVDESNQSLVKTISSKLENSGLSRMSETVVPQPSSSSPPPFTPAPESPSPPEFPPRTVGPKIHSRPTKFKKKKSSYLQKPKVLVIGDSVTHSANFAHIERQTNTRIKSTKAYSTVKDERARYPIKNFTDVTPAELYNTHEEDEFSHLILGAPSVDISNLDTKSLKPTDSIEVYKQNTFVSCQNMMTVAEHAAKVHPKLEKVVIVEHAPRDDPLSVDPTGLKAVLAEYANYCLTQMVQKSNFQDKIVVGRHDLKIESVQKDSLYKDDWSGRQDGVHFYGSLGKTAFTDSLCQIVKSVCLTKKANLPLSSISSYHTFCPQAQFQQRKYYLSKQNEVKDQYNVPVHNKYSVLGN